MLATFDDVVAWFDTLTVNEARDCLERLSVVTEGRAYVPGVIECDCGCGATKPDNGLCECGRPRGHD